ncbi:MAG: hypothetical protein EOP06_16660, partial [Proteobacteria bacterium]
MKNLLTLVFLFFGLVVSAQQRKVTVAFNNTPINEAISKIENASGLTFYFDPAWFKDETVSGNFVSQDVSTVLQQVLSETNLNFFIDGQRVILTQNSVIYDQLPENYFGETPAKPLEQPKPVFYKDNTNDPSGNAIALVGKENQTRQKMNQTRQQ